MVDKPSLNPLDRLFKIQELLSEARSKAERRTRVPDHLQHVEAAFQDVVRRRQEAAARIQKAEARKRVLDGEIAELNEQVQKTQAKRGAVKTNREYGAFLDELDQTQRAIREREDEILRLEEALQGAQAEAAPLDEGFAAEQASYDEQMGEWRAEQARLLEEATAAERAAAELKVGIDKRLLVQFDRIAKMREGLAIARVVMAGPHQAACSACHVRLRPQLLSDLRLSREMVTCESCKRILYFDAATSA